MSDNLVRMKVERGGDPVAVIENILVADAGDAIRDLAAEPDVTVTISWSRPASGEIMLAISGGKYFLGLVSPQDEVYQYVAAGNERLRGRTAFTIHGERTEIESRYVVDAGTAVAAIQEWMTPGRKASSGHWMKM